MKGSMIGKDHKLTGRCRPRISFLGKVILQVEETYLYGEANPYNGVWQTQTRWRDCTSADLIKDFSNYTLGLNERS